MAVAHQTANISGVLMPDLPCLYHQPWDEGAWTLRQTYEPGRDTGSFASGVAAPVAGVAR
jgi:hypothetical protein